MAKLYPSDIWRLGDSLDPHEKLVALALLDYGERIYPSQAHVAIKTGLSLATVKRVMRTLRSKLVITVQKNRKGLSYAFVMAQRDTTDGVSVTPQKCQPDTGSVSHRATNYPKNYSTNQSAATAAAGGVGLLPRIEPDQKALRRPTEHEMRRIGRWPGNRWVPDEAIAGKERVFLRLCRAKSMDWELICAAWELALTAWAEHGTEPCDWLTHNLFADWNNVRNGDALLRHRLKKKLCSN